MKITFNQFVFWVITFLIPELVFAQAVYLSPSEALKTIFATSGEVVPDKKTLSPDAIKKISKALGYEISKKEWTFYIAKTGNVVNGYALVDNEKGKMEPITFLTAINTDGTVKDVEVLVYRESYGSEVHQKPFLRQYNKKKSTDPIRVGQDIKHITGATISSRAISTGVKRALIIWNQIYGTK